MNSKIKYADLPPKKYGDWRDSFGVRKIDMNHVPGAELIEMKINGREFQLYPNEFQHLLACLLEYSAKHFAW